jgi:hypothetical protein
VRGGFTLLPLPTGQDHARHGAILREANKLIDGSPRGKLVIGVEA